MTQQLNMLMCLSPSPWRAHPIEAAVFLEYHRISVFIYTYICGCPKQSGAFVVFRPTKYQTINLHGPMGPSGPSQPAGRSGARQADGGWRRPAGSATQFGALCNRYHFLNEMNTIDSDLIICNAYTIINEPQSDI